MAGRPRLSSEQRRKNRERSIEERRINHQARRLLFIESRGNLCEACGVQGIPLNIKFSEATKKAVKHPANIISWPEQKAQKHLKNARVVCNGCARDRALDPTLSNDIRTHGIRRYKMGCRCPVCRMAMRIMETREANRERVEREVLPYGVQRQEETKLLSGQLVQEATNGMVQEQWAMPGLRGTAEPEIISD